MGKSWPNVSCMDKVSKHCNESLPEGQRSNLRRELNEKSTSVMNVQTQHIARSKQDRNTWIQEKNSDTVSSIWSMFFILSIFWGNLLYTDVYCILNKPEYKPEQTLKDASGWTLTLAWAYQHMDHQPFNHLCGVQLGVWEISSYRI